MIAIMVELPDSIHNTLSAFIENGQRDLDTTIAGAIALFLLQSGESSEELKQGYLKAIFDRQELK